MNEYLTIKEVTVLMKVSRTTVYNWMNSGKLIFYKVGRLVRIKSEDLKKFIESK